MKTCINCGKTNPDAVEYCTCGYHFLSRGNENAEKIAQYISNSKITNSSASSGDTIVKLARNYFIGSVLVAIVGAIIGFACMLLLYDGFIIGLIIVGASVVFAIYGWLIKVLLSSYGEMVSDTNRTKRHAAVCEDYLRKIAEKLCK